MTDPLPIQPTQPGLGVEGKGKSGRREGVEGSPSFSDILKNSIKEVNALQKEADSAVQDLAQGKTENVSEVLTAVEKADLAFRALMQVRNKLLEAYEEINRLRV